MEKPTVVRCDGLITTQDTIPIKIPVCNFFNRQNISKFLCKNGIRVPQKFLEEIQNIKLYYESVANKIV